MEVLMLPRSNRLLENVFWKNKNLSVNSISHVVTYEIYGALFYLRTSSKCKGN